MSCLPDRLSGRLQTATLPALGFYRSQTAENVIETYRRAVGEYGVLKEMLTDNGRRYTNWRGTTRFEKERVKDRGKHTRSRPHHPMTLGKIERFWKSILSEFLQRAQFTTYEDAGGRIAFWVKYYNYKRPHQGIGGLYPADKFFKIDMCPEKGKNRPCVKPRPRRNLSGNNACRAYFSSSRLRYNNRKRKEAYDWIRDLAVDISARSGKNEIDPTAWRVSARKWMEKHRLIIIRKPAKVLPDFPSILCHN